jgi:maltose alpha-D-glucosyltransferase/alpha-amylase
MARRLRFKGETGELTASSTRALRQLRGPADEHLEPSVLKAEQSNTSVIYGDKLILKLIRRLDAGTNPELEIGRFLTERTKLAHVPPVAGFLEYRRGRQEPLTVAILQGLVPNEGDAWQYTLDALDRYFERALTASLTSDEAAPPVGSLLSLSDGEAPEDITTLLGPYLESAMLLGQRTGELHLALASSPDDANFAPETITPFYQRSLYQSMRNLTSQVLQALRRRLRHLPEELQGQAQRVLDREETILGRFRAVVEGKITGTRIRCHGDYHLGQILYTGKDFVIIDFEGEPARPLSERRIKRSALRDVAGLLRSFHYAAYSALFAREPSGAVRPQDTEALEPWSRLWYMSVSAAFLRAYLATASRGRFLPSARKELEIMLDAYLLEKAIYELGYELNNRPDWVRIPLQGILDLLALEPTHAQD